MLTYVKVLLHHLNLALFRTLLQSMLCKLENDLYHLETQRVVQVQTCPEMSRVDGFNVASNGFLFTLSLTTPFLFTGSPKRPGINTLHVILLTFICHTIDFCINTILLTAC